MGLKVIARGIALSCLCVVLTACASTPGMRGLGNADFERAANVGGGALIMYAPASFGSANGGRMNVDFVAGVFAQSAQRVHLLSYDRITKTFRQDMSFETASIPGVALVSGPLGRKQLQIKTESGVVACEIGGVIEGGQVVSRVYDRLVAGGIPTFVSPGWVKPVVLPQPLIITVYIPAAR